MSSILIELTYVSNEIGDSVYREGCDVASRGSDDSRIVILVALKT
jgi:hypothetical protein